jgi:hypothetical protein
MNMNGYKSYKDRLLDTLKYLHLHDATFQCATCNAFCHKEKSRPEISFDFEDLCNIHGNLFDIDIDMLHVEAKKLRIPFKFVISPVKKEVTFSYESEEHKKKTLNDPMYIITKKEVLDKNNWSGNIPPMHFFISLYSIDFLLDNFLRFLNIFSYIVL